LLAERGYRVGLLACGAEGLHEAADEITSAGGEALPLEVDVADAGAVEGRAVEVGRRGIVRICSRCCARGWRAGMEAVVTARRAGLRTPPSVTCLSAGSP
jgi:hypothetical protein